MRTFDFSPLFRSTVGFDRMAALLDAAMRIDEAALAYPPYNIERADKSTYRITMAVAGFTADELSVELRENTLVIGGRKQADGGDGNYFYRGIGSRSFERRFQLADHVKVAHAHLDNGLLRIDLVHELPEELRPHRIEISTSRPAKIISKAKKLIENVKRAA